MGKKEAAATTNPHRGTKIRERLVKNIAGQKTKWRWGRVNKINVQKRI